MPNDSFPMRLYSLEGFQNRYRPLLLESVMQQFESLEKDKQYKQEIDIQYLLTCASIFAQSNLGVCQDAALRIAQYVITEAEIQQQFKEAAIVILDTMTNYPAITLAEKRKYLNSISLSDFPTLIMMDMMKRKLSYSLWNEASNNLLSINKFQEKVFEEYTDSNAISISAPTSSGKSFILLQIVLDFILRNTESSVLYIVPTRALIQQVSSDINDLLKQNSIINTSLSSVPSVIDDEFDNHIYILTQERLHWLLEDSASFSPDCMIVDEAQKIGDGARGIILQQAIEEVARRNSKAKILFASPMTDNPEILFNMLSPETKKEKLLSDQVTVNQNLLWVNCINEKNCLWDIKLCVKDQITILGTFKTPYRASSSSKRLPFVAYSLSDFSGGNLIYVNGAAEAEKVALILYDLQCDDVEDERLNELIKLVKKSIHSNYSLVIVLKRRIAFHYGNMPLLIKNEIEKLFKLGCIKFLVCTSTLMEGVNLPAKSIFLRVPQKGRNIPMDAVDFWNLAGRAGRQGKEFQGNIICVDTNNKDLWKDSLYTNKIKYPISSSVHEALRNNTKDIIDYINKDLSNNLHSRNSLYDHSLTYLLEEYVRSEGLRGSRLKDMLSIRDIENFNSVIKTVFEVVTIPYELLLRHQGVSPIGQQSLFNYFKDYDKNIQELIPLMPEAYDAVDSYNKVICRIQKHIEGETYSPVNYYRAMLVVKWMRGYTLARIISENEQYINSSKSKIKKGLPAIIRDTMSDIEEYVRFRFVKNSACYLEILKYYLSSTDNKLAEQIPSLNIWLEFGASQNTQISLMNLGLSRTTAIALSDYISADNLDMRQCVEWINKNDYEKFDLSEIIKEEIRQTIRSSYLNKNG